MASSGRSSAGWNRNYGDRITAKDGRQVAAAELYGSVTRQFDLAGRMTRLTWNDGFFVTYERFVTGEIGTLREYGSLSGPGVLASFGYDDLGRRTALVRGNGAATYYGYDPVSRLAAMTHAFPNSAANDLNIGSIAYNPAGQIVGLTRSNDAYAWTGNGSGTTATTVNGINQLATVAGAATAHDGRGNLTLDPTTARIFGYWSENELVATSDGYGFGHDMFSRIIDTAASGAVTRQFVHDGPEIVATVTPGVGLTERYVRGDGADELLVEYAGSGTNARTWLHADERGSIIARSDTSGTVTAINRYDEYGKPAATNVGRFQYTGQMWLPEIGLHHYKNRAYAPHLGRFMQTDPIGYEGGMNLYAYVGNDPVNFVDPLGLTRIKPPRSACPVAGNTIVCTGRRPKRRAEDIGGNGGGGSVGDIGGERGSGALIGKIGRMPSPPKTKKLSQCIQNFMSEAFLGFDWSQITISSANPLPGMFATNWGNVINAGSNFGSIEADKDKLFHELAHSPQWAAGELTRSGYIGSSMMAGLRSLGQARLGRGFQSLNEMHDSIPIERAADKISDVLLEAYEQAGSPCE